MKKTKVKNTNKIKVVTPPGTLSYPFLGTPDTGRQYSDNKFKSDFFISAEDWKNHPDAKKMRAAVLKVGRKFFNDDSLELDDFKNPFKNFDKAAKTRAASGNPFEAKVVQRLKGAIFISPKSEFQPMIVGANKDDQLTEAEVKKIKGGDQARLVVIAYPYSTGDGGVTLGLNLVQYIKSGEALGSGAAASLNMIDDIEIEPDDLDTDEEEDESPKPSKKAKKVVEEKDEEEPEEEESEDEPEEEESEDEESSEDDEEEVKPKRGRPAKKKAKKSDEDDEDFAFDSDD